MLFLRHASALLSLAFAAALALPACAAPAYPWLKKEAIVRTLEESFPPPAGFIRAQVSPGSYAEWLRRLPLKPPGAPVRMYDGRVKWDQNRHAAVIDIDTGDRNLQQCADAIIRLRAEYLFSAGRAGEIAFNYTDGTRHAYRGRGHSDLQRYLKRIFTFAGTHSLEREMPRAPFETMGIGDIFIQGGFPGHAVLVADIARRPATGEKRFLLLQSFIPAQDMHILKDPKSWSGSPWFAAAASGELITPDWIFKAADLRRFRD